MKKLVYIAIFLSAVGCEQSPWSEDEKNSFMKDCMEETQEENYCRCYMNNVMEEYPQAEDSEGMSFEEAVEFSKECK